MAPERLVYTDNFADEHGNPVPRVVLRHGRRHPDGDGGDGDAGRAGRQDSDDACARRHAAGRMRAKDASAGWNESFDKMAAALADVQASR